MSDHGDLIIVTGFGGFQGVEKNPSWEAVLELPGKFENHIIEKYHVPVIYEEVDEIVKKIWKKNPYLVIHVGLDGNQDFISIEERAPENYFSHKDTVDGVLKDGKAIFHNEGKNTSKLQTKFNTEDIVKKVQKKIDTHKFVKSDTMDPFLCGYIYMKSLDINSERTLFVHVPLKYNISETSKAIFEIINICLHQLNQKKCPPKKKENNQFIFYWILIILAILLMCFVHFKN